MEMGRSFAQQARATRALLGLIQLTATCSHAFAQVLCAYAMLSTAHQERFAIKQQSYRNVEARMNLAVMDWIVMRT